MTGWILLPPGSVLVKQFRLSLRPSEVFRVDGTSKLELQNLASCRTGIEALAFVFGLI